MRKVLIYLIILVGIIIVFLPQSIYAIQNGENEFFSLTSSEEFKFRDVPDSHWAAPAVYKLVNLGITKGFPDGTFRGLRTITRYELASFLGKLADALGYAAFEKVAAELKSDLLKEIRQKESSIVEAKKFFSFTYDNGFIFANNFVDKSDSLTSPVKASIFDYRLQGRYVSDITKASSIKVNFDTMYLPYYNKDLNIEDLFDVEGRYDVGKYLSVLAIYGPGSKSLLVGNNIIPSEIGRVYKRPYPGVKFCSKTLPVSLEAGYFIQKKSPIKTDIFSEINISRITAKIGYPYEKIPILNTGCIEIVTDYYLDNSTLYQQTNFKPSIIINASPFKALNSISKIKLGAIKNLDKSRLAILQDFYSNNLFNFDERFRLSIALVGSNCIIDSLGQWDWLDTDIFDRVTKNSTRRVSFSLEKKIKKSLKFLSKASLDLSPSYKFGIGEENSRLTVEGGFSIDLNDMSHITVIYRNQNEPNAIIPNSDFIKVSFTGIF